MRAAKRKGKGSELLIKAANEQKWGGRRMLPASHTCPGQGHVLPAAHAALSFAAALCLDCVRNLRLRKGKGSVWAHLASQ